MSSCRQLGMDMGPIPWTAIAQYVDRYKLDEFEEDLLRHCISVLDKIQQEKK